MGFDLGLLTTDDISRLAAFAALMWSVGFSLGLARRLHNVFAWHLVFCAAWSVVAAIGMLALLDVTPTPVYPGFVEVLNLSWSLTLGAWVAFVWRLHRAARAVGQELHEMTRAAPSDPEVRVP